MNFRILILLLMLPLSLHAEIYKWKDSNGVIRYSDTPPPINVPYEAMGSKKSTTTPPAKPSENAEQAKTGDKAGKQKTSTDADAEKRQQSAEDLKKKEQDKEAALKQKQENCSTSKNNLQTYKLGGRITRTNDKGEREYLSDADIANGIAKAQKDVDQFCN